MKSFLLLLAILLLGLPAQAQDSLEVAPAPPAASADPATRIAPGQPVPAFSLALLDGGTVSDSTLLGTTYLVDFWASWCGPCLREMGNLHVAYDRFHDQGFEILSIALELEARVLAFREAKWPMPWLNVVAEDGVNSQIAKDFEVPYLPRPLLVGPDGRILTLDGLHGESLHETLTRYLGGKE